MIQNEKVKKLLKERELDAVIIIDGYNMRYLSGFTGATGYLYISENRQIIFTDFRYTEQAKRESKGFEVSEVFAGGYIEAINKRIEMDGAKRVGFEDEVMLTADYCRWKEKGMMEVLVPLGGSVNELRCIKTQEELENIRKAEEIGDRAFEFILGVIKPGMTELEVAAELEYHMKRNGAWKTSFDTIVASGFNSSMPHAVPGMKKIEKGDFITMDFGCVYNGYCSDMTRTVVAGRADDRQKKIYYTVLEAQKIALDRIRAGLKGKEIDKAARDYIDAAGYKGCFGHGLGHSVGLYIHEEPRLSVTGETVLQENMIETVEPGIYIPGYGGVRIEDLVVVTKTGHVNFTHSDKKLIEL